MTTDQTTTERLAEAARVFAERDFTEEMRSGHIECALCHGCHDAHYFTTGPKAGTAGKCRDPHTPDCPTLKLRAALAAHESQPSLEREAIGALRALPLDAFDCEMDKCDAADFVDHAHDFFTAMQQARAVLAKAERKG